MPIGPDAGRVRIAELVPTLSYAADLGLGQPMEHCLRQTVIALRLGELVGADDDDREATYYLGLLANAYCHADASEQAKWFGDDISMKADLYEVLAMNAVQTAGDPHDQALSRGVLRRERAQVADVVPAG
jgi:hypothetical protein